LALRTDGVVVRISDKNEGEGWDVADLAKPPAAMTGAARLFAADMDNNGSIDVVVSGKSNGWVALSDESGTFDTKALPSGIRMFDVIDLNGDGRLDLVGLSDEGRPVRGEGNGSKTYHWQVLRPRAARVFGDGRINSFGIGGEVELRAGLLVQKQPITGPVVHF